MLKLRLLTVLAGLMVPRHKLSSAGWRAFSVAALSVWNSVADYLRDPDLGLDSF